MKIIQHRSIWFTFSGILVVASVLALIAWNLKLGIDFTGGSLLEVEYSGQRPDVTQVEEKIQEHGLEELVVQPTGEAGYILRFAPVDEVKHQAIKESLGQLMAKDGGFEEMRFESIGPVIGEELKDKSLKAMIVVLVAIVLYIGWAFRKVSRPVTSWKYGIVAILTLFHDTLIVLGLFVLLGKYLNVEINVSFVAAILTLLGYSVNDTIVVFDRIRENLSKSSGDFEETVNKSINETLQRSVNTSVTTLLALLAIYLFGGETVHYFVLALIAGVIIGTYSSIFIASPLLVVWQRLSRK